MIQTTWAVRESEERAASPSTEHSPLFLKLLQGRGFVTSDEIQKFLNPRLEDLLDPFLMKGMREAVNRLRRARQHGEKVLIHGDYDADGITGAAILSHTLEKLQIAHETFLPERLKDGYGVSLKAIEKARGEGVRLLVTVDCGISAKKEITEARKLGIDCIVLDHHQLPATGLPPADAILNPLQPDCSYPFKELSAGGLAFKLAQALLGEVANEFFDLATLSTVADLAPLRGENRIIVKEGLASLSERKRVGIQALTQVGSIRSREIKTSHVGFMLGPRINASGRMGSALTALRLLLTSHFGEAESLARILEAENRRRQKEERKIVQEAIQEVERTINFTRDRVIVVAKQGWHAGVIGIVASRLVERYHRPSLVIALDGETGKGSGRSIRSFHLFKALEAAREFFMEFGGHEQAVGFKVAAVQIPRLKEKLNEFSEETYPREIFLKSIDVDLEISLDQLTPQFIRELVELEPHGIGNPKPVFLTRGLRLKDAGVDPKKGWVTDGLFIFEMTVSERSGIPFDFDSKTDFDLVYTVARKVWEGEERIILEARDAKPGKPAS